MLLVTDIEHCLLEFIRDCFMTVPLFTRARQCCCSSCCYSPLCAGVSAALRRQLDPGAGRGPHRALRLPRQQVDRLRRRHEPQDQGQVRAAAGPGRRGAHERGRGRRGGRVRQGPAVSAADPRLRDDQPPAEAAAADRDQPRGGPPRHRAERCACHPG